MLDKDYLLIGHSERTSSIAINTLRDRLFQEKVVRNVVRFVVLFSFAHCHSRYLTQVRINIPEDRSSMHIDTLFTQISADHVVAYEPVRLHRYLFQC